MKLNALLIEHRNMYISGKFQVVTAHFSLVWQWTPKLSEVEQLDWRSVLKKESIHETFCILVGKKSKKGQLYGCYDNAFLS